MTDTQIKQSLVDEFLKERLGQYERHFSSPLWKKSIQPYLKALYEMSIRKVLTETDHTKSDMQKGMALAYENILNLPKFIEFMGKNKTNPTNQGGDEKLPGYSTGYLDDLNEMDE
jgi:hypothetical protein